MSTTQHRFETLVSACLRRVRCWTLPPNWSHPDWLSEVTALGRAAAHEAFIAHDDARGTPLPAFVASRVMSRILTRYRQEWRFASRTEPWDATGEDHCHSPALATNSGPPVLRDHESVRGALARLSDADRWIVVQLFWYNRDQTWVARQLGISQPAISKRRTAILRKLRAVLTTG